MSIPQALSQVQGPYTTHNVLSLPGFVPHGTKGRQAGNLGGYITEVVSAPNGVSHFTDTGHVVRKPKKTAFVTEYNSPRSEPGVFKSTVGHSAGAGTGLGTHEFKTEDSLHYALNLADRQQSIDQTAKYWPEPEHYRYFDRSKESVMEYFENVAEDNQRRKIQTLKEKGFSEEHIHKYLEEVKYKDIGKALKDPSNLTNLLEGQVAASLPTRERPDFPVRTAEGAVAPVKDASASQLAFGTLSRTQKSKVLLSRRLKREEEGPVPGQQRIEELLLANRGQVEQNPSEVESSDIGVSSSFSVADYVSTEGPGRRSRAGRPPIFKKKD